MQSNICCNNIHQKSSQNDSQNLQKIKFKENDKEVTNNQDINYIKAKTIGDKVTSSINKLASNTSYIIHQDN